MKTLSLIALLTTAVAVGTPVVILRNWNEAQGHGPDRDGPATRDHTNRSAGMDSQPAQLAIQYGRTETKGQYLERQVRSAQESTEVPSGPSSTGGQTATKGQRLQDIERLLNDSGYQIRVERVVPGALEGYTRPEMGVNASRLQSPAPDFNTFKSKLRHFTKYKDAQGRLVLDPKSQTGAKKIEYYLVEEDLALNELDLSFYHREYKQAIQLANAIKGFRTQFRTSFTSFTPSFTPKVQLRAATDQGHIVRWSPGSTLSYCVLKWTFSSPDRYELVRQNMLQATRDWADVVNLQFEHRADLDNMPDGTAYPRDAQGNPAVLFTVVEHNLGGAIAMSFFPNDSVYDRQLIVDPNAYYTAASDRVGILRHELGHILGFRHEHISPDAPVWSSDFCNQESAEGSLALTPYERGSVMHYPCYASTGGKPIPANYSLLISSLDAQGSQAVYGPRGGPSPRIDESGNTFLEFSPSPVSSAAPPNSGPSGP